MKSIRFKLWIGMMSLVSVVLILLWLFQIVFLDKFYTQMKIRGIENRASAITGLLEQNQTEFDNQMEALAYDNNLSIELLDLNGQTIYQTSLGINGQMMQMRSTRNQVFENALTGIESAVPLTHPRFGNKYMLIGLPVNNAVMILTIPLAPVEETVSILQRQLIYISFILLGTALLVSFLLARSFTRPILDINGVAEKMARGDFSARSAISRQDEIGQLAKTINYLGEQLAQIDQLRKDLIANVSHELRTPLSLIRGYAETLRDVTGGSPDKRNKQLGIIIDETERLSSMVDDILNLSQLQSGNLQLNQDCFSVQDLINRVAQRYELLSQQNGVALKSEARNLLVKADEARIEQVLYNLINNAFNHVNPGGHITVAAAEINGKVRLEVVNTGSGIDAQDLPRIWDRYYKTSARMAGSSGTGLGLAIVKAVLEAHGTAFGADSQPGEKTTFWFELNKC